MKFSEDSAERHYRLSSYGEGWIQVNEQRIARSFVITADRLIVADWEPQSYAELKPEHLTAIFELQTELILIGTGKHQQLPTAEIYKALVQNQVGFELMTTDAACRTYNVLLFEARTVVAILFPD